MQSWTMIAWISLDAQFNNKEGFETSCKEELKMQGVATRVTSKGDWRDIPYVGEQKPWGLNSMSISLLILIAC